MLYLKYVINNVHDKRNRTIEKLLTNKIKEKPS